MFSRKRQRFIIILTLEDVEGTKEINEFMIENTIGNYHMFDDVEKYFLCQPTYASKIFEIYFGFN